MQLKIIHVNKTFLLKRAMGSILHPNTFLGDLSFTCGVISDSLTFGRIVLVVKGGDRSNIENYRPIPRPAAFSKIFDCCFLDWLLGFLDKLNILSWNQHGFYSGKSTSTAIFSVLKIIYHSIEVDECPLGIFCDLSKAFDCVNQQRFSFKLLFYGVNGLAFNWIENFHSTPWRWVYRRAPF